MYHSNHDVFLDISWKMFKVKMHANFLTGFSLMTDIQAGVRPIPNYNNS